MRVCRDWTHGLLVGAIAILTAGSTATTQSRAAADLTSTDPAVAAYISYINGKDFNGSIDRAFVVAALDQLLSAVEGVALAQSGSNGELFDTVHHARREVRRLSAVNNEPVLTKAGRNIFVVTARLVINLDREVRPRPHTPRALLESLKRAADGFDHDDPLRLQPSNLKEFFSFAAEALAHMARR